MPRANMTALMQLQPDACEGVSTFKPFTDITICSTAYQWKQNYFKHRIDAPSRVRGIRLKPVRRFAESRRYSSLLEKASSSHFIDRHIHLSSSTRRAAFAHPADLKVLQRE